MMAQQTTFQHVLDALVENKRDIPTQYLPYFSDMDPASLKALMEVWPRVTLTRKLVLLDELLSLLDSDTLVSFDDVARALLTDADSEIRARAIRLLAESDDPKLVPILINILQRDKELAPRLEAATLLGEFVMMGELEELPEQLHRDAEQALFAIESSDEKPSLRRRALESLGYSERPEVVTLIESAFHREDPEWKKSALVAMGRSNDDRWEDQVISMLLNEDPRIRNAAVESAGDLRLASARPILLRMMEDEEDDDVLSSIIWSLSEIGGDDVRVYLLNLIDQTEDEEVVEYLEDALANLDFTEELDHFDLLSLDGNVELDEFEEDDE